MHGEDGGQALPSHCSIEERIQATSQEEIHIKLRATRPEQSVVCRRKASGLETRCQAGGRPAETRLRGKGWPNHVRDRIPACLPRDPGADRKAKASNTRAHAIRLAGFEATG